jgi:hypothetical protein
VQNAAVIAAMFGGYPDEALDCDSRRWQIRLAGALYIDQLRNAPT